MKLLTTFSVLVAVPRVFLRDVFGVEGGACNGAGALEYVELVVGDSFEKRGSSSRDGACSKVIGDSAEDFKHLVCRGFWLPGWAPDATSMAGISPKAT